MTAGAGFGRRATVSADVPPASIKPLRAELGNFERPPVS